MKITFDNNTNQNVDRIITAHSDTGFVQAAQTGAYALDISGTVTDNTAYGVHGRTTEEVMQSAENIDVTLLRNYMTVMSNSMSTEDFAKLQKEGYSPTDTDIEKAVTIVDKIKSELVKAGVNISGYTDDLDRDILREITGSEALANELVKQFRKNDIPVTKENAQNTMQAYEKAEQVNTLSEGEMKYMVSNQMEPTIDHLYTAHFTGSKDADRQGKGYYADEMPGYYSKKAEDFHWEQLQGRMEQIIEEAGLPISEDTMADAKWLVEKGLPLTKENVTLLSQLKNTSLPASMEQIMGAIAGAIADGKQPGEANLYDGRSVYQKAADILEDYTHRSVDDIKSRRQLEEIRLLMTVEANVKLLKSGFSIDTAPMEELVDALKQLEEQRLAETFGTVNEEDGREKQALLQDTLAVAEQIPELPAAALGVVFKEDTTFSLQHIHEEGKSLQAAYEQAETSYETMMTTPRKDMGDSIKTAFRNVDAILDDMGYELTEENRRAVRILGYNQMPIEEANILMIKEADITLRRVVEQMTPAVTLQMIRDGINPLETGIEELYDYLYKQNTDIETETESYSKFLHRLDKQKDITPEERESYIGIYRMLRQIEKSDGAVIGNVVQSGAELNFRNLLTALRTGKKKGMDINVDDTVGGVSAVQTTEKSISQQIESGYQETAYYQKVNEEILHTITPEQLQQISFQDDMTLEQLSALLRQQEHTRQKADEAFRTENLQEQAAQIHALQDVEENVVRMLHDYDLPVTVNYMTAAGNLFYRKSTLFQDLHENIPEIFEGEMDALQESMTDRDSAQKAYEEFNGHLTDIMEKVTFEISDREIDVKTMQAAYKQLHITSRMAAEENYEIPVQIGQEITALRLKILHNGTDKGKVSITMDTETLGKVTADFQVSDRRVSGYAAGNTSSLKEDFQQIYASMKNILEQQGYTCDEMHVVQSGNVDLQAMETKTEVKTEDTQKSAATSELYQVAKVFIRALQTSVHGTGKE